MRFARWVFLIAGVYGIAVLVPGLFGEARPAAPAARLAHPEYYYGFLGSALVWQLAFIAIARNPARLRPLMPIAVLEKLAFFGPCLALYYDGRLAPGATLTGGIIDGVLMIAFALAWWSSRPVEAPATATAGRS